MPKVTNPETGETREIYMEKFLDVLEKAGGVVFLGIK